MPDNLQQKTCIAIGPTLAAFLESLQGLKSSLRLGEFVWGDSRES